MTDFSIDHIGTLSAGRLRQAIADASRDEDALSFFRRIVQGRADIVISEARRRQAGEPAGDVGDLISQLPTILGDHQPPAGAGRGRPVSPVDPGDLDPALEARLSALVSPDQLSHLPSVSAEDLQAMIDGLSELEREVSGRRHHLHEIIDAARGEIGRRYQAGEIHPEDVIAGGSVSS
jgi:hypothetical protein